MAKEVSLADFNDGDFDDDEFKRKHISSCMEDRKVLQRSPHDIGISARPLRRMTAKGSVPAASTLWQAESAASSHASDGGGSIAIATSTGIAAMAAGEAPAAKGPVSAALLEATTAAVSPSLPSTLCLSSDRRRPQLQRLMDRPTCSASSATANDNDAAGADADASGDDLEGDGAEEGNPKPARKRTSKEERVQKYAEDEFTTARKELQVVQEDFDLKNLWGGFRGRKIAAMRSKLTTAATRLSKVQGQHSETATSLAHDCLAACEHVTEINKAFVSAKSKPVEFVKQTEGAVSLFERIGKDNDKKNHFWC